MNGYFEGWYYRQRSPEGTVALIPAYHRDSQGREFASLQILTQEASYRWQFDDFFHKNGVFRMGGHRFSRQGLHLSGQQDGVEVKGWLRLRERTPLPYDIMGPFRLVPFMQCRHSVFSMTHRVDGFLQIDGRLYRFDHSPGYMEGDRGSSFPGRYIWTQANWKGNSIMLSAADIPLAGRSFTGCIAALYVNGRHFRMATYTGARVDDAGPGNLTLRQGDLCLEADAFGPPSAPQLWAPQQGAMSRTVHENVSCPVRYRLWNRGNLVLKVVCRHAAFESDWNSSIQTVSHAASGA